MAKKTESKGAQKAVFILISIVVVLGVAFGVVYQLVPKSYFQGSNKDPIFAIGNGNLNLNTNASITLTATDEAIQKNEELLAQNPQSLKFILALSGYYLQKIRESFDTSYYAKIDDLVMRGLAIDPNNADLFSIKAAALAGKHRFKDALEAASQSVKIAPKVPGHYAILVDAQVELGMYKEAEQSLQTMVDIRPDFVSFSRISYFRELHNDVAGAIEVMQKAVTAGAAFKENVAWGYVELGKLYFLNDLKTAEQQFQISLQYFPNYAPANKWLGRVYFAQGDKQKALEYFQKAFQVLPVAEYATDLSDVYKSLGNAAESKKYQTIVEATYQQYEKNGVNVDQEYALFLADRGTDFSKAVEKARKGYEERPGIYGADTLAWALYKNGNYDEAAPLMEKALQLSTPDGSLYFHAGMLAKARGDAAKARELLQKAQGVNQNFSLLYNADYLKEQLRNL